MSSSKLKAAIIDLDGTMVDTLGDFVVAINLMLHDMGYAAVDRAVVELRIGKGSEHLVSSILDHATGQLNRAQTAPENIALHARGLALYQEHYRAVNGQHAQVYAGVVDGLVALQQKGLKLACLTNKPVVFARELLMLKDLDSFFTEVFGGDSFATKKPDPLPVIKTCEALGTVPAQTLMVGDSINDARAARAAGCPVVLVTYGYNHGEPASSAGADAVVDSMKELEDIGSLLNTSQ